MAVTDLTGYTWVGNEEVTLLGGFPQPKIWANIDFESNGVSWTQFITDADGTMFSHGITYLNDDGNTNVYFGVWDDNAYRTITITGGSDVEDTSLIAWLEANGTLTPPATPSLADKLLAVNQIKQDIKDAIVTKGVDMTGVPFTEYADKVAEISGVVELTQAAYDALTVKDPNTYYIIVEV